MGAQFLRSRWVSEVPTVVELMVVQFRTANKSNRPRSFIQGTSAILRTLSSFLQTIAMLSKFFVFFKKMFLFLVLTLAFLFRSNFVISYRKDVHTGENSPNNFKTGINKISEYLLLSYLDCEKFSWFKIGLDVFVLGKIFHHGKPNGVGSWQHWQAHEGHSCLRIRHLKILIYIC